MHDHLRLANLRIKKRLSQYKIAKHLNISLSTYKLYELGEIPIKLEDLNFLSNYFKVSMNYLLGISENETYNCFKKDIDYKYMRFCIRLIRRINRVSQKKLAKEFNISYSSINRYEHDGSLITLSYLILIAKKFNVSADYICGKSLEKKL